MGEVGEDEIKKMIKVCASIFVSLSYCYFLQRMIPKGFTRLVAILPIISLFIALPLNLTSVHFCGFTAFFIAWLANFKLLLFAFGNPPLCTNPPISFSHFLCIACLPIKISTQFSKNVQKSLWNYVVKGALFGLFVLIFASTHYGHIPPKLLWIVYSFHICIILQVVLAGMASAAKLLMGVELEPQFKEPLLSTSLRDFWGRRWNLMVTSILRTTVYLPTRNLLTRFLGRRLASPTAVMTTFTVSGLMHELVFYYLGRGEPTFEVTWFFLLHGLCHCVETEAKSRFGGRWRVPRWVSGPLTLGFIAGTGFGLFLPPFLGTKVETKAMQEYAAIAAWCKNKYFRMTVHLIFNRYVV